jgi:hypothetical protein
MSLLLAEDVPLKQWSTRLTLMLPARSIRRILIRFMTSIVERLLYVVCGSAAGLSPWLITRYDDVVTPL